MSVVTLPWSDGYSLSDTGVLLQSGIPVTPYTHDEYPYWLIAIGGDFHRFYCHRLVAKYFVPNPHNLSIVNHIDGNKFNFCPSNLEWTTQQENVLHAFRTGLNTHTTPLEIVHAICKDIADGKRNRDICKKYHVNPIVPSQIRHKKRHKEISDLYF